MKYLSFCLLLLFGMSGFAQTPTFKNVAIEYCKKLGYKIVEDPITKERRCILPNGEKVNPWDFFHGDIGKEYSYCVKKGYDLRIKEMKAGRSYKRTTICDSKVTNKLSKSLLELLYEDTDFSSLFDNSTKAELPDTVLLPDTALLPPPQPDPGYPIRFSWDSLDNEDWVSSPQDQSGYGICYAMAASSVAESVWNYAHNTPIGDDSCKSFSPYFCAFVGSCADSINPITHEIVHLPVEWWSMKGSGGLRDHYEADPLAKLCTNGIVDSIEFPTNPSDTTYSFSPCERYRFTSYGHCNSSKISMKQYLMTYGPLWTTMIMDIYSLDYTGVILVGNYVECGTERDQKHAVAIVGWDYDEASQCEYWIVKNSYGSEWGIHGYLHVATDNAYGINCEAYYLTYAPVWINGGDLAYNQQTIYSVPEGHVSIQYKPEPHSAFNGLDMHHPWIDGITTSLQPKNVAGQAATITFKAVFRGPSGGRVDPDSVEYYTKNIWAGKPCTPTISGPTNLLCETPVWFYANATSPGGLKTAETFSWSLSSGLEALTTNDNPPSIQVKSRYSGGTSHTITLTAINNCGSTQSEPYYVYSEACDSVHVLAYPNPASNEVSISIENNMNVASEFELKLLDSKAILRKVKKTKDHLVQWNVQDLPNGNYTIKVRVVGKTQQEKITNLIIAR